MQHLGNICNIDGTQLEPVDVVTFGSPCQDLSVAGKRAGLAGERSGLFHQAVRVIKEMREASSGRYPRFAVWENVPGAFSSNKGNDFHQVLRELIGVKDEQAAANLPRVQKWQKAGAVVADQWSIAWRVLDAQFFGLALLQRLAAVRGRLSLCADQAAAAKWWLSMPMASVSAEGPMPKALSTRRTSPLMPGCRHQGRACPLRRARMTSNPLIVA